MKSKVILLWVMAVSICAIPMVEAGITLTHDNVTAPVYTPDTITIGETDYQAYDNDQYVPADLAYGKLNIMIHDDTAADYTRLHSTFVPAPSALFLGIIGFGCVFYLRRRKVV